MGSNRELPIVAIMFGGDGYIGRHMISSFLKLEKFDRIYVYDLKKTETDLFSYQNPSVIHMIGDVRQSIHISLGDFSNKDSWIFNLAAVHREPGHEFQEYFDTNIPGAKNINEFARQSGIKNLFFTSSIAPYGRSLNQRDENSPLYPETGYGISKALAEKIHENWLNEKEDRRLIIVRPSVIFGPNDPGNVYRMLRSLKKGTFILPDGGKIIKAYGYVYGLVESIVFTMNKEDRYILYNYAENPLLPLNEMVKRAKTMLGYSKPTLSVPTRLLAFVAFFVQKGFMLLGKRTDIHPVRVRKAGFPTNIKPGYLLNNGFPFKYNFEQALDHWRHVSPEDFE